MLEKTRFLDLECVRLGNKTLSLLVTESTGPRIIALQMTGGQNLFAQLPEVKLQHPSQGELTLWGGHRLWHAPEMRRRTYLPDDEPVSIQEITNGVQVTQQTEEETGIQKSLRIFLPDESPTVIVDHTLTNQGLWPVECAPWAITQLRTGGTAILPQTTAFLDSDGLLPNRQLALWPYLDMNSPSIEWGNRFIFVSADMKEGALKLGFPNPSGWLGYYQAKTLFIKKALYDPEAVYVDQGSSSECYCDARFLELETLGPISTIDPTESVTHREVWHVYDDVELTLSEEGVESLASELDLAADSPYLEKPNG